MKLWEFSRFTRFPTVAIRVCSLTSSLAILPVLSNVVSKLFRFLLLPPTSLSQSNEEGSREDVSCQSVFSLAYTLPLSVLIAFPMLGWGSLCWDRSSVEAT